LVMFSLCFEKHKRKQWDSGKEERWLSKEIHEKTKAQGKR
jgi:hypothetical protein